MQYSLVAALALAGSVLANPAPQAPTSVTITTSTTTVITITSCAPEITDCPAMAGPYVTTSTIPVVYSYPAVAAVSGGLQPTGNCPAGAACAYATGGYNFPSPTPTGYTGTKYTSGGEGLKAAGALAGVGAVAALLL